MLTYKTYIDEAGNTGDNLLDLRQPLFVLSAVSVPTDRIADAEKMCIAHFRSVKEKEETEIKATQWFKAPKKQQAMSFLLRELQMIGAQYHLVVVEKRFMIAGWALNTFFDYANVGSDDMSFVNDIDKRKVVADYYERYCTDEELAIVGEALRKPTRERYLNSIEVLLRHAPEQSCHDILKCAERNVDVLLAEEVSPTDTFNESVFHTPNLTAFLTLGNMIAGMCKKGNAQTSFVYDDCSLCNSAYYELFKNSSRIDRDFKILTLPMLYTWRSRVLSFTTAKSQLEPLLQTADILAACTDKIMQKIGAGINELSSSENSIMTLLGQTFLKDHLWLVASRSLIQQFVKTAAIIKDEN